MNEELVRICVKHIYEIRINVLYNKFFSKVQGLSLRRLAVLKANTAWQGCAIWGPSCIAQPSRVTQLVYFKNFALTHRLS
jgi:hypothetical protein